MPFTCHTNTHTHAPHKHTHTTHTTKETKKTNKLLLNEPLSVGTNSNKRGVC